MVSTGASLLIAVVAFSFYGPLWVPLVGVAVGLDALLREPRLPSRRPMQRRLATVGIAINAFFALIILTSPSR